MLVGLGTIGEAVLGRISEAVLGTGLDRIGTSAGKGCLQLFSGLLHLLLISEIPFRKDVKSNILGTIALLLIGNCKV